MWRSARVRGAVLVVSIVLVGCSSGPKVTAVTGVVTTVSPSLCIGRAQATGVCFPNATVMGFVQGDCVTVAFEGVVGSPKRLRSIRAAGSSKHAADCPPDLGSVSGMFVRVGGPSPGAPVPLPGRVTFTSLSTTYPVAVGPSGEFVAQLPAGRYHVSGTSPLIQGGHSTCAVPEELTVVAGATAAVRVVCAIP